eukprot:m.77680 g.77680  ORF g.77680 m.77680 type:complete len:152 (+) comp12636_c0_seq1:169-624(+)
MASKDSDQNLQEGNEAVESEEKIAPSEESVKDSQEGEETNNYPELPRADLLLEELEQNANKVASDLAFISGGLRVNLHALSNICRQYIEVHQLAVNGIGETVDRSLAAMSSLMVGCEQISENMPPVEKLIEQLKSVKKTLDILEDAVLPPK